MNSEEVAQLFRALADGSVEYVLVGGVALNLHGIVRATQDIDLFVKPTEANLRKLKSALQSVWPDKEIDQITLEDLSGEFPTIRYGPPSGEFSIDILARLGQTFAYDGIEFETIVWRGVSVRVATAAMLYRMKKDTPRAVDQADALELKERFGLKDMA